MAPQRGAGHRPCHPQAVARQGVALGRDRELAELRCRAACVAVLENEQPSSLMLPMPHAMRRAMPSSPPPRPLPPGARLCGQALEGVLRPERGAWRGGRPPTGHAAAGAGGTLWNCAWPIVQGCSATLQPAAHTAHHLRPLSLVSPLQAANEAGQPKTQYQLQLDGAGRCWGVDGRMHALLLLPPPLLLLLPPAHGSPACKRAAHPPCLPAMPSSCPRSLCGFRHPS